LPGTYTLRLTAGNKSFEQSLTVTMDPRVKTPPAGLTRQFELSLQCYEGLKEVRAATAKIRKAQTQIKELQEKTKDHALTDALSELDKKATALAGAVPGRRPRAGAGGSEPSLGRVTGDLEHLLEILQSADAAPTSQAESECGEARKSLTDLLSHWREIQDKEIKAMNEKLQQASLPPIAP
jgi:hypothetical protein